MKLTLNTSRSLSFPAFIALTGALQGWVLWWLWHTLQQQQWPATQPLLQTALLYAAMVVPLVIYWTQKIDPLPTLVRQIAPLVYGLIFAGLGAYSCWVADAESVGMNVRPTDAMAAMILGFVSLSLLCGFDFATRRENYAHLFNYTWRNVILTITAGVLTGTVWTVLFAGAALMKLIGVTWIMDMITEPIFVFPVTGLVVAGAFALGLARASMIDTLRRFWLSIASWLLLLVLFFGVVWVVALPFMGLDGLFKTKSAAIMMLWFTALAVKFSNCAYQDGEVQWPYPRWLSRATQAAWLSVLPMVAIAWWALGLRVMQYGWTENRLWASLVALLAAIYALGYALSWRKTDRWMGAMGHTNIAAALVLCLGLFAFLSPVTHVQRLAVASQMNRVTAAAGSLEPDWKYLRWESGRFGRAALQSLAAGQDVPAGVAWAEQATKTLAQTNHYESTQTTLTTQQWATKFAVYPKGKVLPDTFITYVATDKNTWAWNECTKEVASCSVWMGDLNGDGTDEIVVFHNPNYCCGTVFSQTQHAWRKAARLSSTATLERISPAQLERAQVSPTQWRDLVIQGQRLQINDVVR